MTRKKATRTAYAELVSWVFVCIRNGLGKDHPNRDDILHDIGDAMHNVSVMLQDDDGWIDDAEYRSIYLSIYDEKWADETRLCLGEFIENKVMELLHDESPPNA